MFFLTKLYGVTPTTNVFYGAATMLLAAIFIALVIAITKKKKK